MNGASPCGRWHPQGNRLMPDGTGRGETRGTWRDLSLIFFSHRCAFSTNPGRHRDHAPQDLCRTSQATRQVCDHKCGVVLHLWSRADPSQALSARQARAQIARAGAFTTERIEAVLDVGVNRCRYAVFVTGEGFDDAAVAAIIAEVRAGGDEALRTLEVAGADGADDERSCPRPRPRPARADARAGRHVHRHHPALHPRRSPPRHAPATPRPGAALWARAPARAHRRAPRAGRLCATEDER